MGRKMKTNSMAHATCVCKRTILKKGDETGLQNVDGDGCGGNLMASEEKAALERGREGTIYKTNSQWKKSK